MAGGAEVDGVRAGSGRYRAFISYSHKDARQARRLHRRLERYRAPGPAGPDRRPIFLDLEELPAHHDLSEKVRGALQASDCLIVVCSPAAAASPWVAREIELFRAVRPDRPILTVLVDGEPADAFPAALRPLGPDGAPVEPLAADLRPNGDGERLALLKLVAGMAGVGLDQLVQRDAARRVRRVTAVTVGASIVALAMTGLAWFAMVQRAEAVRQRAEAEGLVEFMLTDLREELKGIGRLDALVAVNRRALAYYDKQDGQQLPALSQIRRARLLHAVGEDEEKAKGLESAAPLFVEAKRVTARLLAEKPDDPERVWADGQSEYWLGYLAYREKRVPQARAHFRTYQERADRLIVLQPNSARSLREAGYARNDLCTLAMEPPKDLDAALRYCKAGLAYMEAAAKRMPADDPGMQADLESTHSWLGNVYRDRGELELELGQRKIQEEILSKQMALAPENMELKRNWIMLQTSFAMLELKTKRIDAARARLVRARDMAAAMVRFDPSRKDWVAIETRMNKAVDYVDKHYR